MKTELYLQIPKPCHENWDAMTAVDKGKFCASCSKEVIDFSLLSDLEVLRFFKKSTGNTCGRFNSEQLQRPLQETKIEKKKSWKWLLASITSLIMISRGNAQKKDGCSAQKGEVAFQRTVHVKETVMKVVPDSTIKIKLSNQQIAEDPFPTGKIVLGRGIKVAGYVVDEKNEPIAGAAVSIDNNFVRSYTNSKGHFEITTSINADRLAVTVKSFGFNDEKTVVDLVKNEVELKVSMKPKIQVLPEIIVSSYATSKCTITLGSAVSYVKVTKKDTVAAAIRKVLDTSKIIENPLKIYPNPAVKNSLIHISIKQAGNYQVQLFDNTSGSLQTQENITTVKQQSIDFQLPANMALGFYYIRLINTQTKRSYTDKLIVQ